MIHHDEHEPAVRQPRLLELVELARAQPLPPLRTTSDMIVRGVAQHRSARMRTIVVGVVLCAAAAWVLWSGVVPSFMRGGAGSPVEQAPRVLDATPSGGEAVPRATEGVVHESTREAVVPTVVLPEPEDGAVVEPTPAEGADTDAVEPTPTPTTATTPASLAREAERAMTERRRDDAIALLRTLVREHPRHPAAKAALFDLGRLFREAGRKDEARCAYRLLARRWPDGPGSDEVGAMLGALGPGPTCRGLRPSSPR